MGVIYTLWIREMKRFIRSKSRIVGNISMPFIWLAIMGVGLNSSFAIPGAEINILTFIAPGIIGMTLLFTSIFSGISVIWDKQFGFLKEILVAPVTRTGIILGKIAGSGTISLLNGIIVLLLAIGIGALPLQAITLQGLAIAFVFMLLVSSVFISLGLIIASKLDNTEGFQMIMSFLVMPLFFLSGAFFPINMTPAWMQSLARIDPLFYGVDGLRATLLGASQMPLAMDAGILAAISVGMLVLASFMFRNVSAK